AREKASDLTGVPAEDRPNYVLTEIEGLPEHIGSHVDIPDFLQLNSYPPMELRQQIYQMAQRENLGVDIQMASHGPHDTNMVAQILEQDPTAGAPGVRGITTVKLTCQPVMMQ